MDSMTLIQAGRKYQVSGNFRPLCSPSSPEGQGEGSDSSDSRWREQWRQELLNPPGAGTLLLGGGGAPPSPSSIGQFTIYKTLLTVPD